MSRTRWQLCYRAVLAVGVVSMCLGGAARVSSAAPKAVPHCVTPTGVDLNERYDVSDTIIAPFCQELGAGRHWTVSNAWFMSPTFLAVPDGFVAAGETPLEDFVAKFIAVKYVIDVGTNRERTYVFPNSDDLATFTDGIVVAVNPLTLGTLMPLGVGDHVVDSYLLFSAMHCDGLEANVEQNCLPAGETLFGTAEFTVAPGHN